MCKNKTFYQHFCLFLYHQSTKFPNQFHLKQTCQNFLNSNISIENKEKADLILQRDSAVKKYDSKIKIAKEELKKGR